MPKGNRNPKITKEFVEQQFERADATTEPLAPKPTQVRLTLSAYEFVESLGRAKAAWLRRVIAAAVEQERQERLDGSSDVERRDTSSPTSDENAS